MVGNVVKECELADQKKVLVSHVKSAITKNENYDFLSDLIK